MKIFTFYLFALSCLIGLYSNTFSAVDTLPPNPTFELCPCCGEITNGLVEDMPKDSTRSNLGTIIFDADNSFNYKFSCEDFVNGEDALTRWQAFVIDNTKDARMVVTFTDFAGNDTTITINYYARSLKIKPDLDFGILPIGVSKEFDCWVINESSIADTITQIKFKYQNQGFEIAGITLPCVINSGDSVKFNVRFIATQNGEFRDSIGVVSYCYDAYNCAVSALVGSAIIDVSYYNYGDIPVNQLANGSAEIRNLGNIDLIIYGYIGPRQTRIFYPDLVIDPDNPLVIKPNEIFTFEVRFLPPDTAEYFDSLFFICNSEKNKNVDSVAELFGRGIKPDLVANSYDWGRRRIDRPNFPAGPYSPDSGYQVIKLINGGTMAVTIYNVKEISNINGSAFMYNSGDLFNKVINPMDSIIVPVQFQPTVPGPHELIIEYDNSAGSNTQTILRGIGTVPMLDVPDYDFGSTKLNDTANPSERLIRITNKSASDWMYGDSATIIDLIPQPNGNEISANLVNWGTEGFRYDKSALSLPVKLAQGKSIEFKAQFFTKKESQSRAGLLTRSDAYYDLTSIWTGIGLNAGGTAISVSDADFGKVLRYSERTKTIFITNISDSNLIITNYSIPKLARFIVNIAREISSNNPLILQPHETWSFDIDFSAAEETPNSFQDSIVFTSNATQGDSIAYLTVDSVVITGVEEFSNIDEKIILSPNPADDFICINFENTARIPDFLRLYDGIGNVVYEKRYINENYMKINTSGLASGLYMLQIGSGGGLMSRKVLVVH
ncbi:MAG: T9SS type A sorting domain-containing protein [Bacteroidetes bacterium]|nr:MAG: T9SS type A sorting domain-containing protein [Bacteroidota bacterium]